MSARLVLISLLWRCLPCGCQNPFHVPVPLAELPMLLLRPPPVETIYDRSVLGNLANKSAIADLRVPHSQSFVIDLAVGSPPQKMRCLLDTGFADLWLPSEPCESCDNSQYFKPTRSDTFVGPRKGEVTEVHYGTGLVRGDVGRDTVHLGWGVFENQSFLLVPQASLPRRRAWDGVCGLGRHEVAVREEPLWKRLPKASKGGHAFFALVPGPGRLHYFVAGQVPYTACKEGTLSWAPAEPLRPGGARDFWVISGGLAIHKKTPVRSRFLLDTGSAFLLAPPHKYLLFVRSLFAMETFDRLCGWDRAAGNVVVCHCSIMEASAKLLPVRFFIGGRAFSMPVPELFVRVPAANGTELCLLQIQRNPADAADPMDLLDDLLDRRGVKGIAARSPTSVPGSKAGLVAAEQMAERIVEGLEAREGPRGPATVPEGRLSDDSLENGDERAEDPAQQRRLQAGGGTAAYRAFQALGEALGEAPVDLMDDLWVIGGVFLERFVLVLDFEGQRVGVAEPNREVIADPHAKKEQRLGQGKAASLAARAAEDMDLEVHALKEENSNLLSKLRDLVRAQETREMQHMKEEARKKDLVADLNALSQTNREMQSRVQSLEYSQEQSRAQYAEAKEEAQGQKGQWNIMRSDLQDLRFRHAALRQHTQYLREENEGLKAHGSRMQFAVFASCCFTGLIALCVALGAYKARRQLLLCWKGVGEGKTREVRDVAPLLDGGISPRSQKASSDLEEVPVE